MQREKVAAAICQGAQGCDQAKECAQHRESCQMPLGGATKIEEAGGNDGTSAQPTEPQAAVAMA
eukprot:scaffold8037_cov36-Tisochrysis_lutea.AAC.1